jgi:nitrite reductase/ring-hydroxylating ferredoxin subunit/uncharacterized membrane protein
MRSKANVHGHPLHAALVAFPLAFISGALIFDILGVALDRPPLWSTGGHLAVAGIVAALVAALPGFIDYFFTVPPHSSAKKRATLHLTVNLAAVGLLVVAVWARPDLNPPDAVTLGVEALAVMLLSAGGWLGGTLVVRNQIGVDHRYADAGKWSEATVDGHGTDMVVVARSSELEVDQMKLIHVDGRRVVVARTERGWVAFDDHCPHRGASLADGALVNGTVQCPWHGSQFDARTGALKAGPATEGIPTYEVRERDGLVQLSMRTVRRREVAVL